MPSWAVTPDRSPKNAVAALKAKRIKVSAAMVSGLKMKMKAGGKKKLGRKKAAIGGKLDINTLVLAKRLADQLGGVEKAKEAMAALAKLQ